MNDFIQIEKLEEVFNNSMVNELLNRKLRDKAHIMLKYDKFATVLEKDRQVLLNEINKFLQDGFSQEYFYLLFNYGTQSEVLVKRKGWKYILDNGVVVFIAQDWGDEDYWTSYESTTGSHIVSDCTSKQECLEKTVSKSEEILNALNSEFNINKAVAIKKKIELGIYDEWF